MVMIGQECCCISKVLTLSRQPYVTERFIMSPLAAVSENNDQFCSVPLVITTSITCKLSQCHCFFFFCLLHAIFKYGGNKDIVLGRNILKYLRIQFYDFSFLLQASQNRYASITITRWGRCFSHVCII